MRRRVFVDTGAFYALADRSDRHHEEALEIARTLAKEQAAVFTSAFVLAESHVLILSRLGHAAARRWLANLSVRVEHGTEGDLEAAKDLIFRQKDQDYSLTDALSVAIMRRTGTADVFGFDRHFAAAGLCLLSHGQEK